MERIALSWSGGKDSALALHELRRSGRYEIAALVTTVTEERERVGMHGVRRELLRRQTDALGLPLREVRIPAFPPNEIYEARMGAALGALRADGVEAIAFGDLFLEDIRDYRERLLGGLGLRGLYPLWGRDTAALADELVDLGYRAIVVCAKLGVLDRSFAGRELDRAFFSSLPPGVDPCGENGEFHTLVLDGPGFAAPVACERGALREEGGFAYLDLLPA